jgi:hypothetical protein
LSLLVTPNNSPATIVWLARQAARNALRNLFGRRLYGRLSARCRLFNPYDEITHRSSAIESYNEQESLAFVPV